MIDYTLFYKELLPINDSWSDRWDLLLSSFMPVDRVTRVFDKANASDKVWLLCPEYGYDPSEYPPGRCFTASGGDEATFVSELWRTLPRDAERLRICIDITGFIRPYLMYLIKWLFEKGVRKFDALYAEPAQYDRREHTEFSGSVVREVRQVAGFEGILNTDVSNDVLIIGSGYEDHLIKHVAEDKAKARKKLQLIGFPSLRADMYQENVLRAQLAEESLGGRVDDERHAFFAPANDPFVAASRLSEVVKELADRQPITNLYLCPLSTKAHVLGFVLYYLWERRNTFSSIIFPFEEEYSKSASKGIARLWKYTVELPKK